MRAKSSTPWCARPGSFFHTAAQSASRLLNGLGECSYRHTEDPSKKALRKAQRKRSWLRRNERNLVRAALQRGDSVIAISRNPESCNGGQRRSTGRPRQSGGCNRHRGNGGESSSSFAPGSRRLPRRRAKSSTPCVATWSSGAN